MEFDRRTQVAAGVAVTFRRAGHILGSAYLELEADFAAEEEKRIRENPLERTTALMRRVFAAQDL